MCKRRKALEKNIIRKTVENAFRVRIRLKQESKSCRSNDKKKKTSTSDKKWGKSEQIWWKIECLKTRFERNLSAAIRLPSRRWYDQKEKKNRTKGKCTKIIAAKRAMLCQKLKEKYENNSEEESSSLQDLAQPKQLNFVEICYCIQINNQTNP